MFHKLRQTFLAKRYARRFQEKIAREAHRGAVEIRTGFPGHLTLPEPFARALPERVLELLFVELIYQPGAKVLDIGHANAMLCHRTLLSELPEPRNLTGIDIADPVYDTRPIYQQSVKADITAHPFHDGEFDQIWCISTLEHFGMDNSVYTHAFKRDISLAAEALREMTRMLKPGGHMLITVPYGRFEDHGWHITYDDDHWARLLEPLRKNHEVKEWFFRHTFKAGWRNVPASELALTGYFDQANAGAAGLAVMLMTKKES